MIASLAEDRQQHARRCRPSLLESLDLISRGTRELLDFWSIDAFSALPNG
jgi:hypothetical protein